MTTKSTSKIAHKRHVADEFYGPPITIVAGDYGTGKTFFCLNHPLRDQAIYLDLEDRYKTIFEFNPTLTLPPGNKIEEPLKLGHYYNCLVYDKHYNEDRIATFDVVEQMVNKAVKNRPKPALIVVDGIGDLRRMCSEKWEADNKKHAFGFQAWQEINNIMKKIIFKLFNFARIENIKILCTSFLVNIYEDGERTNKKEIDVKDYIIAKADEILLLHRKNTDFIMKRGKSPRGPKEEEEWTIEFDR